MRALGPPSSAGIIVSAVTLSYHLAAKPQSGTHIMENTPDTVGLFGPPANPPDYTTQLADAVGARLHMTVCHFALVTHREKVHEFQ